MWGLASYKILGNFQPFYIKLELKTGKINLSFHLVMSLVFEQSIYSESVVQIIILVKRDLVTLGTSWEHP